MSDPFWDELNDALPRARRGEPGWADLRRRTMSRVKGDAPRRLRMGLGLAAGLAVAAVVVLRVNERKTQALASVPTEDLEFLEQSPMLEQLDVLLEAEELDRA